MSRICWSSTRRFVHGQHRNNVEADCWTFFVSLVDPEDRDYKDGVPNTSHNHSNVIAHELGFFASGQWSYDAVHHFLDHPELLQQYTVITSGKPSALLLTTGMKV